MTLLGPTKNKSDFLLVTRSCIENFICNYSRNTFARKDRFWLYLSNAGRVEPFYNHHNNFLRVNDYRSGRWGKIKYGSSSGDITTSFWTSNQKVAFIQLLLGGY
jgi:hypothetical protein